jgi:TRAP-type C4-dicarboxylate transport system permease small subunit
VPLKMPCGAGTAALKRFLLAVQAIGSLAAAVLMLQIVVDVTLRYIFNNPLRGTIEYVQFWWMPLLAAAGIFTAQARGEHIRMELVAAGAKPVVRRALGVLSALLTVVFVGLISWHSAVAAYGAMERGEATTSMRAPIWPVRFWLVLALLGVVAAAIAGVRTEASSSDGRPPGQGG